MEKSLDEKLIVLKKSKYKDAMYPLINLIDTWPKMKIQKTSI